MWQDSTENESWSVLEETYSSEMSRRYPDVVYNGGVRTYEDTMDYAAPILTDRKI